MGWKTEAGSRGLDYARPPGILNAKPYYRRSSSVVEMPAGSTFLSHSASKNLAQESILPAQVPRAQSAKRTRTVQNQTPFKIKKPASRLRSTTWKEFIPKGWQQITNLPAGFPPDRDGRQAENNKQL
jgi:hypothetical protein